MAREVRSTECSDPNLTVAFREAALAVALAEEVEGLCHSLNKPHRISADRNRLSA